jgi:hypothetical protein
MAVRRSLESLFSDIVDPRSGGGGYVLLFLGRAPLSRDFFLNYCPDLEFPYELEENCVIFLKHFEGTIFTGG